MKVQRVQPPTSRLLAEINPELGRWLSVATAALREVRDVDPVLKSEIRTYTETYGPGIDPGEVAITVAFPGVTASDAVWTYMPIHTANVSLMQTIAGSDEVTWIFRNFTSSLIPVPNQEFTVFAVNMA